MIRALPVAALVMAAASGSARADSSSAARATGETSVYGLGAGAGWGRAMLRPTSDPAALTYLRYTELNGIVAKFLILLGAAPQQPTVTISNVESSTTCDDTICTTRTTWTETEPTEADWIQYEKDVQEYSAHAAAVMAGAVPLEFTFDLALKSLGGDASGFSTEILWREPFTGFLGMRLAELAFGLNWTRFSYSDVMREQARFVDDATIAVSEVAASTTYSSFGFPVRFMVFPFPRLALYTRLDLNMLAMVGALIDSVDDEGALKTTYHPNLMHGGAILYLGIAYLRADVAIDGGDVESLMYTGELGLQF